MAKKESTLCDFFLELLPSIHLADAVITELEGLSVDIGLNIIKKSRYYFCYAFL